MVDMNTLTYYTLQSFQVNNLKLPTATKKKKKKN